MCRDKLVLTANYNFQVTVLKIHCNKLNVRGAYLPQYQVFASTATRRSHFLSANFMLTTPSFNLLAMALNGELVVSHWIICRALHCSNARRHNIPFRKRLMPSGTLKF